MQLVNGHSTDPIVNEALEVIESDLREALVTAIGRLNAALEAPSSDNQILHSHAADLHRLVANIDENRRVRARGGY